MLNKKLRQTYLSLTREFERDIISYTLGKAAVGIGAFLFIPILVQVLGLETYGQYGLVITTCLFIYQFSSGWLKQFDV